jgi:hypothetical protein
MTRHPHAPVIAAVSFLVILHALDFITTLVGNGSGICESNPLYVSTVDGCSLLALKALTGKSMMTLIYGVLPAAALEAAFGASWLSSIPFWYMGYHMMGTVAGNVAVLLS